MLPSVYAGLDNNEKAFVIAAIQCRLEADRKKAKELERRSSRKYR